MVALVSTTGFFMPLEKNMLLVYVCTDTWMNTTYKCFEGVHLAAVIAATATALALAVFAFIGESAACCVWLSPSGCVRHTHHHAASRMHKEPSYEQFISLVLTGACCDVSLPAVMSCFFVRDPKSGDLVAKPHGRIEVVNIFFKLILSFTFLNTALPASVRVFVVCVASSTLLYCYYVYLPFFDQLMNQVYVSFSAVYTWASFCALVAEYRQKEGVRYLSF